MGAPDDLQRELPSVDALLRSEAALALLQRHPAVFVATLARELIASWRESIRAGNLDRPALLALIAGAGAALEGAASVALEARLRRVINATGVVVHTNLGRAPWPERVARRAFDLARGYSNLEYDIARGARGQREAHLDRLATWLGAEAVLVVNNCAAALLLALDTLARDRETVISRGQLVEIGGSFRVPEIMAKGGSLLREVGTTNRTRLSDYERAITERTALLLRVHPSNFRVVGFHEEVSIAALATLGRQHGLPVVDDMGSGNVLDLAAGGLAGEARVADSLRAGADLVLFSGDKLLGGPQAGIVVGRSALVSRLRANALYRALRPDKVTIAAIEELVAIHVAGDPWREIPVLAALALDRDGLRARSQALQAELAGLGYSIRLMEGASTVGGGAAPLSELPTLLLAATHPRKSASELEAALRHHRPPVIVRVEDNAILVDLRTVASDEDSVVRAAFACAWN